MTVQATTALAHIGTDVVAAGAHLHDMIPGPGRKDSIPHPDRAVVLPQPSDRELSGRTELASLTVGSLVPDPLVLRSSQTAPATAPRMITAPIAMNQVMMLKIAPIVP